MKPPVFRPGVAAALGLWCALSAGAQSLAVEIIDPASRRVSLMNERGDVVGTRTVYPCAVPATCIPQTQQTVWTATGERLPLPGALPGIPAVPSAIAADGTVAGTLTDSASRATAVIWRRVGGAYKTTALGNLGLQQSYATDIDASGRVVGYAITPFVATRPFSWTAESGMVDLAAAGAPAERIFAVSPGGRVLSDRMTWPLDAPEQARPLPDPPATATSWFAPVGFNFLVNDAGDLGGFLQTTSGQNRYHLHRWTAATGNWQLLDPAGVAPTSGIPVGVARIEEDATITATIGAGVVAHGPAGLPESLSARVSPAYPANAVQSVAWRTDGDIYAATFALGTASRAVRLVPIKPCRGACMRVTSVVLTSSVVPASRRVNCGQPECTLTTATVTVTDAAGNPMSGVKVGARFMNAYTLDGVVGKRTDASGTAILRQVDFVGMGTVSVIIEAARLKGWKLDRGVGQLTAEVIPR